MCGIAGFRLSDEDLRTMDSADIVRALGLGILERGKDAAGVCTVSPSGRIKVTKETGPIDHFLKWHRRIGHGAKLALIHTRYATQGSEKVWGNNHPVLYKSTIGVHNGMIHNDFELWRENPGWTRSVEVDTEAVFAAIHEMGWEKGLGEVDGSFALAWIDATNPLELNLAKGSSPLCVIRSTSGSIFFASTAKAVLAGAKAAGLVANEKDHVVTLRAEDYILATEEGSETKPGAFADNYNSYYSAWSRSMKPIGKSDGLKWTTTTPAYDEDEDFTTPLARVGDEVFVYTDRGVRIDGVVGDIDPTTGMAFVEWFDCEVDLTKLDVQYRATDDEVAHLPGQLELTEEAKC